MTTHSTAGRRCRFNILAASIFPIVFVACGAGHDKEAYPSTLLPFTPTPYLSSTRPLPPIKFTPTFAPSLTGSITPTPTSTSTSTPPPENWVRLGPDGGRAYALAVDPRTPTTVYAGTRGGIFKSINGGDQWKPLNSESCREAVIFYIAVDPNNKNVLYIICKTYDEYGSNRKAYKSINGGIEWQELSIPDPTIVIIDSSDSNILIAGGEDGLYKSEDGGAAWEFLGLGEIDAIAIDPTQPSIIYAASGSGTLYKSTDGGTEWKTVWEIHESEMPSTGYIAIALDPTNPRRIYFSVIGGIYTSADGGEEWVKLSGQTYLTNGIEDLLVDPTNPKTLYIAASKGLYKSTDGGKNWQSISAVFPDNDAYPDNKRINAIAVDKNGVLYATAGPDGIYKTTDGGENWFVMNSGLAAKRSVTQLIIDPFATNTVYAGVDSKIFKTFNQGKDWLLISSFESTVFALSPNRADVIYQVYDTAEGRDNFEMLGISVNGGGRWKEVGMIRGDAYVSSIAVDSQNEDVFYAGVYGSWYGIDSYKYNGVYKSIDGGKSWNNIGLMEIQILSLGIDPVNSHIIYAGTLGEGIMRSKDGGMSWTPMSNGFRGERISSIVIDPSVTNSIYAVSFSRSAEGEIRESYLFKSIDGGNNWTRQWYSEESQNSINDIAVDPQHSNIVFIGTNSGVYKSLDGGVHWYAFGLLGSTVTALAIDPTNPAIIYTGTDSGVYYLKQENVYE